MAKGGKAEVIFVCYPKEKEKTAEKTRMSSILDVTVKEWVAK